MRFGARAVRTLSLAAAALAAGAETLGFDRDPVGAIPMGWACGSTDGGAQRWTVEADDTAPSPPNVLKQSGSGSFPWCVKQGTALADGFVEVKVRPLAGIDDQAGGVVWRWKDGDNYYVARIDALEGNVALYYTEGGRVRIIRRIAAPAAANDWHTLRVEFSGASIRVLVDGQSRIEFKDSHIVGPGAVGVWTSADSVTAFDDFSYQSAP